MRGKTGADREISVNTYTGGFTTMLNHHLRNRNLSLKAVGLLSKMLSLPPDWDYSIRGLAMLNTDGIDGIRTAMKELEDEGYVVRVQSRDERGRMSRNKYTVYALPQKEKSSPDLPSSENPTTVKPPPDEPMTEKPTQINTNQVIPKKRNDSLSKYQSINPDGMDAMDERERYEEIIRENLEVDILSQDSRYDIDRVNEIIEVMLDAICSTSPTLRVNNTDMPKEVVKSRLLKLNSSHIDYVFDAMRKSPSDIRNIRAYMLTALYNAPATINTIPFKGGHYAAYPPKLVETCLLAGCPEDGIVLDPFLGSGTTAMVAKNMGRHYVGIELNPEFTELAYQRIGGEI